jgi:hypothetical protein
MNNKTIFLNLSRIAMRVRSHVVRVDAYNVYQCVEILIIQFHLKWKSTLKKMTLLSTTN